MRRPPVCGIGGEGAAGALSTRWPITLELALPQPTVAPEAETMAASFLDWLARHLPPAGHHRLYFDHGERGLDAGNAPFQRRMDAIAREKGYRDGKDLLSQMAPGANRDEAAWRARLATPLAFLLRSEP